MPIISCQKDGRPGFKFGELGFCYTYKPDDPRSRAQAIARAELQMRAIKRSQAEEKK